MKHRSNLINLGIITIILLLSQACTKKKNSIDDPAARVGDHWLSKEDVRRNIPAGISGHDSITAAKTFINNWVENEAVMVVAERNIPDTEEIDRLVENYRRELLMWEYRRRKIDENISAPELSEQQIDEYINLYPDSYTLEYPIVKGVYLKISEDAPELKEIIKLYKSDRTEDIDKLEKLSSAAINYEYFRDKWMDWQHIENRIPYDGFINNPNAYPFTEKNLEHKYDGYVYLLHITDILKPGNTMPSSYARPFVIEAIQREKTLEYDKTLRQLLTSEALSDGTAQIY